MAVYNYSGTASQQLWRDLQVAAESEVDGVGMGCSGRQLQARTQGADGGSLAVEHVLPPPRQRFSGHLAPSNRLFHNCTLCHSPWNVV